jgi:peptidoglycan hydrolase CwlO-like protein
LQATAQTRPCSRALALIALGLVATMVAVLVRPVSALAETIDELTQRVTETSAAYDEATERVTEIQTQIDQNQQRIQEIKEQLPSVREQAASSIRSQYKLEQSSLGIIDLLLSTDDFYDFLQAVQFLDSISSYNTDQITELVSLTNELNDTEAELDTELAAAQQEQQNAADALKEAQDARTALQEQIAEEQAAEEEAAKQALEEAATDAGSTFTTESGTEATVEVPASSSDDSSSTSTDTSSDTSSNSGSSSSDSSNSGSTDYSGSTVNWNTDKATFVSSWGSRINSFLAGSPLAGYGETFAEAAWTYGIDPRLSPAIAAVESSKGLYCFKSHNAWGWGSSSWSDWNTAIWAHVAGLSSGYGSYLTWSMTQKYCPPNAAKWYSSVAAYMEQI